MEFHLLFNALKNSKISLSVEHTSDGHWKGLLFLVCFYLFSIWGSTADGCRCLVAVSRYKVVADLREKRFEHTNIKPHCFIWILLDMEGRVYSPSLDEAEWKSCQSLSRSEPDLICCLLSWNRLSLWKSKGAPTVNFTFWNPQPAAVWFMSVIITWLLLSWAAELCSWRLLSSTYNQNDQRVKAEKLKWC